MVTEKMIKQLLQKKGDVKVTLAFPTIRVGANRQQNPIRFKNLLSQASNKLLSTGLKEAEADKLLEPARSLLGQPLFWSEMEHGMIVYLADDFFQVFKIPYETAESAYVHSQFLVTPLLPLISTNGSFCVLATSQGNTRLLRCTRTLVTDITPQDIPLSVSDWLEEKPEPRIQFHTGNNDGDGAMFFGHGSSEDHRKEIMTLFFRDVEKAITDTLKKLNDPLLLAGLKPNTSLYRRINRYKRVLDRSIDVSPDNLSDSEIRDMGWVIIRDYFLRELYESMERLESSPSHRISRDPAEIITSTVMGKSAAIFITKDRFRWGRYDEKDHKVHFSRQPRNGDVDLLNWLTIKGLETGSKIYVLPEHEMPGRSEVAAIFRF